MKDLDMPADTVELQGTLRADGVLILDERPNLPPGRVRVTLEAAEAREDVLTVLKRIHAEQAASGHVPRSAEEIDAALAAMRQEDEVRMQEIERLHEACERAQQQTPQRTP